MSDRDQELEKRAREYAESVTSPLHMRLARDAWLAGYRAREEESGWRPERTLPTVIQMPLRGHRARSLTAYILKEISPHLERAPHELDLHRKVSDAIMRLLYDSGAEVITDADRRAAGLEPRGELGMTATELHLRELSAECDVKMAESWWQPIETAPESPRGEGGRPLPTRVLLWGAQIGVRDGEVFNFHGRLHANVVLLNGNAIEHWGVTHWRPLPAPPKESGT